MANNNVNIHQQWKIELNYCLRSGAELESGNQAKIKLDLRVMGVELFM